jgi:hypothetical protein
MTLKMEGESGRKRGGERRVRVEEGVNSGRLRADKLKTGKTER